MGLKSKKGRSKSKNRKSKGEYRRVASMWESRDYEGQHNISVDDYYGKLYFKDKKSGELFEVKYLNCFDPKPNDGNKPPKGLVYNLCLNLKNEEAAIPVGEADDNEKSSGEEE